MRKLNVRALFASLAIFLAAGTASAQDFKLTSSGYFNKEGVDVMAFDDIYPEGHQGGISILMNGRRIATSGDIRLESTPGQWQQTEYCLGGASSHYMFIALAAQQMLK